MIAAGGAAAAHQQFGVLTCGMARVSD
jgi:hypothetical protein